MNMEINDRNLQQFDNISGRFDIIKALVEMFPKSKNIEIAFLGYSDLMHTSEEWNKWTDNQNTKLEKRKNHEKLKIVHGRMDVEFVPTIQSTLTTVFGERVKATVFDFQPYEGSEVIHDFNYPIEQKYHSKFDIVLDFGSIEHIFNIAQAIANLALITKKDGLIFNENPLLMLNHGFYSLNPVFYYDFFTANEFEVKRVRFTTTLKITRENGNSEAKQVNINGVPASNRFRLALIEEQLKIHDLSKGEFVVGCLAQKTSDVSEIKYPTQGRYQNKENWI
jgi:hypothetical protein